MSTAPAPARGPARAPTPTPTPTPATPRRTPSPPPAAAPDTWTPHPLVRNGTVPDPPPAWWFSESVYHVLQQIPRGRATTYGHIAALAGFPRHARQVGVWLREYGDDGDGEAESAPDDDGDGAEDSGDSGAAASTAASWRMPWHRVVAAGGRIAPRAPHAQMALQASRLDAEGVAVVPVDVGGGLETTWRIVHWPAVRWCPSPDGGAGTAST
ncbi:hypothetical protein CXG81DRAFT_27694 [Caulochytrium protostelioides]|uniref:Methylated-DNA-[protein]-cysteine S-methyltransferase DNA binding domain-containing protein n=1 Tax=Caulochytrium protostelioides TaxID=1555241 RepID=A0A4P9X3F1_9FUNG|nr:hypothetical protein CXG81DRAFT_27694 [Caulochytrium protostelioides]|eukprot:RKO99553.1 hypothetical protein CXG81DRAFT_27694 [Caulochytrium protostelioides]